MCTNRLSKYSPFNGNCRPWGTVALSYNNISPGFRNIFTFSPLLFIASKGQFSSESTFWSICKNDHLKFMLFPQSKPLMLHGFP